MTRRPKEGLRRWHGKSQRSENPVTPHEVVTGEGAGLAAEHHPDAGCDNQQQGHPCECGVNADHLPFLLSLVLAPRVPAGALAFIKAFAEVSCATP